MTITLLRDFKKSSPTNTNILIFKKNERISPRKQSIQDGLDTWYQMSLEGRIMGLTALFQR